MNCDQAFECLTDPGTEDSAALEAHLQHCPRCRDMAETLEPALRYVTGQGDAAWPHSPWETPASAEAKTTKPFLSPQAVKAAEEAAAVLKGKNSRRSPEFPSRWLAAAVLTPLVLLALIVADRIETDTREASSRNTTMPAMGGLCLRETAARSSSSSNEEEMFKARDMVRSCNVCHLLERPAGIDKEHPLKLRPADTDENVQRPDGTLLETDAGLQRLLKRNMAGLSSRNRAC